MSFQLLLNNHQRQNITEIILMNDMIAQKNILFYQYMVVYNRKQVLMRNRLKWIYSSHFRENERKSKKIISH